MRRALFCVAPEKEHLNLSIEPDLRLRTGSFEVAFYAPAILDHNKAVTVCEAKMSLCQPTLDGRTEV